MGSSAELFRHLRRMRTLREAATADPARATERRLVTDWQAERLRRTHRDLLRNPRYRPALEFFLADLYGPKDFTGRDRDFERIAPMVVKVLPSPAVATLALALEMDVLTQELDGELGRVLVEEMGAGGAFDSEVYVDAFRRIGDYPRRRRQVDLIEVIGRQLDGVVRRPMVAAALRMARRPARIAGLQGLQDFLERGFAAFREMGGANEFLAAITSRERRLLDRFEAGHPRPFDD